MHRLIPLLFTLACAGTSEPASVSAAGSVAHAAKGSEAAPPAAPGEAIGIFAMGCFWCGESDLEHVSGVLSVQSGYTGGPEEHPTYEQVSAGSTGHAESVLVRYDPTKVTYQQLLDAFWRGIDPFQKEGQFCDHGHQYRSAIFPLDETQKAAAEASIAAMDARFEQPIATRIEASTTFWLAEDYHQDFYKKSSVRYSTYRLGCGRDARTEEIWGTPASH